MLYSIVQPNCAVKFILKGIILSTLFGLTSSALMVFSGLFHSELNMFTNLLQQILWVIKEDKRQ